MAITLDVTNEVIGSILFLLLCLFGILVYIAYLLKRVNIGGMKEVVIEKHFVGGQTSSMSQSHKETTVENDIEDENEKRERAKRDIELSQRWNQGKKVESNIQVVGNKEVKDGKGSIDAVNLMRKMAQGEGGIDDK